MSTPLPIIANISRIVSSVVDRITGDRSDYPLLVAAAAVHALRNFGIKSQLMYGQAAWIEVLEDHSVVWAGCWGKNLHFWAATEHGEVVDLNTSVAHRKRAHDRPELKALYSPPMLWSAEVPRFYRYVPEGVAEIELSEERDRKWFDLVLREIDEKCQPALVPAATSGAESEPDPGFPNEAILCPGRKLLDDSRDSFRHFDRALSVRGIPQPPL
ncbi:MAG: hypothetical protein NDJ89_02220 [Oligoflexia bacterium]|nr:hypothetical protein [Oligoflexia bacterium]